MTFTEVLIALAVAVGVLLLPGCATSPKPDVKIQIEAPIGEKPNYSVTITM